MEMRLENRTLKELFDLTGKAALVIGGSGYVGRAMSQALSEAGARVAVGSRSQERANVAADRLPGGLDLHLGLVCDMADERSTRQGVDPGVLATRRQPVLPRPSGTRYAPAACCRQIR